MDRAALLALLVLLPACAGREAPPAPAAAAGPAGPDWAIDLQAAFEAQDWPTAEAIASRTLAGQDLGEADRAFALYLRSYTRLRQGDGEGEKTDLGEVIGILRGMVLPPGAQGADLRLRLRTSEIILEAGRASLDPAVAAGAIAAVPVLIVPQEYLFLERTRCGPDLAGTYQRTTQRLAEEGGHAYDVLEATCTAGGGARTFWFGVDVWLGALTFGLGEGGLPDVVREAGFDEEGARFLVERGISL